MYALRMLLRLVTGILARLAGWRPHPVLLRAPVTTLIADTYHHRVIEVDLAGAEVWHYGTLLVPGSGPDQLSSPSDAERLPNGNTLIADSGNHRVLEVTPDRQIAWSYGPDDPSTAGYLNDPRSAERLANGNTLIADAEPGKVLEVDATGAVAWRYPPLPDAWYLAVTHASRMPDGTTLVTHLGGDRVFRVDRAWNVVWEYGPEAALRDPYAAHGLANGDVLIAEWHDDRVAQVTPAKQVAWEYARPQLAPIDARRLPDGNTLVTLFDRVLEIDPAGTVVWSCGGGSGPGVTLEFPRSAMRVGGGTGPDLMVRPVEENGRPVSAPYLGAGIFNLDAAGQTTDQAWWITRGATFALKLVNAGTAADTFQLSARVLQPARDPRLPDWSVRFYDQLTGGNDITQAIFGNGWSSGLLGPGAEMELSAHADSDGCGSGEELDVLVTAVSLLDPSAADAVKFRAKTQILL